MLYNPTIDGRVLSSYEAYSRYGIEVFDEIYEYNTYLITKNYDEPASTFKDIRLDLGYSVQELSELTGLTIDIINSIENPRIKNSIDKLEHLSVFLGIDDKTISKEINYHHNRFALRLKALSNSELTNLREIKAILCKSSSIMNSIQYLYDSLYNKNDQKRCLFMYNNDYNDNNKYAYDYGYKLANEFRKKLNITGPIFDLTDLVRSVLKIPLLIIDLPPEISAITLSTDSNIRGILINKKKNIISSFRNSLAHELCHVLYDGPKYMKSINYEKETINNDSELDFIEKRANAFAVELLTPVEEIKYQLNDHNINELAEKYGVGPLSLILHIRNRLHIDVDQSTMDITRIDYLKYNFELDFKNTNSNNLYYISLLKDALGHNLISKNTYDTYSELYGS